MALHSGKGLPPVVVVHGGNLANLLVQSMEAEKWRRNELERLRQEGYTVLGDLAFKEDAINDS